MVRLGRFLVRLVSLGQFGSVHGFMVSLGRFMVDLSQFGSVYGRVRSVHGQVGSV